METTIEDRKELDRINTVFEKQYGYIQGFINKLKVLVPDYDFKNLGLYSGNKMRSLYRRFKEKNIDYPTSLVNAAVEDYLIRQIDSALYIFSFLISKTEYEVYEKKASLKQTRRFILTSSELSEYNELCESVYNFNLERDICGVINEILDESTYNITCDKKEDIERISEEINLLIDIYNEELEKLGIEGRIEHRDIKRILEEQEKQIQNFQQFADALSSLINTQGTIIIKVKKKNKNKK